VMQRTMNRRRELRVRGQDRLRVIARLLEKIELLGDVRELHLRQAMLADAKELAGAAQAEVHLGDFESVAGLGHGAQAVLGVFGRAGGDENAIRRLGPTTDTAAELMKLRHPES